MNKNEDKFEKSNFTFVKIFLKKEKLLTNEAEVKENPEKPATTSTFMKQSPTIFLYRFKITLELKNFKEKSNTNLV